MKLRLTAFLACLLLPLTAAAQADFDALGAKLEEYARALDVESPAVRNAECDMLIESAKDSLVRQFVATKLYELYLEPRVMGTEATAVYIVDNWFSTGKVKMHSDFELMNAEIFADFNRQSLVGCPAPPVTMQDSYGASVSLFEKGGTGKYTVLYFYDTDCSTCKRMTPLLTKLLESRTEPLDIYPIYSGGDYNAWMKYIAANFSSEKYHNLWDPGFDSGFQEKYGILSTPKLFLVAPDGTIVGRGLDPVALETLLEHLAVFSGDLHPAGERPPVEDTVPDILYHDTPDSCRCGVPDCRCGK